LYSKNGLISLETPLSEEPNLGKWTIEAHDKSKQFVVVDFQVKKYVLPKFEVYLDHKKSIVASDEKMNVSVCAKYVTLLNRFLFHFFILLCQFKDILMERTSKVNSTSRLTLNGIIMVASKNKLIYRSKNQEL
jgi:hypothetical protein